jgi:hypothetical protein
LIIKYRFSALQADQFCFWVLNSLYLWVKFDYFVMNVG